MSKSENIESTEQREIDDVELSVSEDMASEGSISELDQLRNIVFGSAKADLDRRIHDLKMEMRAGFQTLSETLEQHVSEVYSTLQENVTSLDERVSQVDSHYDYKVTEIDKITDKLAEEIESNNVVSKQQDDDLYKHVDSQIQIITDEFTNKHNQTIDLLNQMKNELNSSKTDKKTLAKLLATVASNLEIEDDSE